MGLDLIRNFVHAKGSDFRWVCDLGPDRTARALDEVLADAGVAAAVVTTPPDTNARLTTQALAADSHVPVEEPLAVRILPTG